MPIHSLTIREHNKQAHIDIDRDILTKKNGLFTFIVRINAGNIVDYCVLESETYARKAKTGIAKAPRHYRKGS